MFTQTKPMFEARFIVGSESLLKGTLKSEKKKKWKPNIASRAPSFLLFSFSIKKVYNYNNLHNRRGQYFIGHLSTDNFHFSMKQDTHIVHNVAYIFVLAAWIFSVR